MTSTNINTLEPKKWVENHADYLYRYAVSRLNNKETARDLIQEVFLAALEKVGTFEGRSTERTWLTSILRFKIIDIYRKKSTVIVAIACLERPDADQHNFFEENGHWKDKYSPAPIWKDDIDILRSKEFQMTLERCMKKLPDMWMSVFTMKHLDEESTKTVCEVLNISKANYWAIIHRAKLNLRACLHKNWI